MSFWFWGVGTTAVAARTTRRLCVSQAKEAQAGRPRGGREK